MQGKQRPGISARKLTLTGIVGLFVVRALFAAFTSEPSGGFINSPTPARIGDGMVLVVHLLVVLTQLISHRYYTFKHYVIINTLYYISLVFTLFSALVIGAVSQF